MKDVVDEKQWDSDDEDDKKENKNDEQRDAQAEKFERDSRMEGEAIEGEMRTREDDEKIPQDKDDKVISIFTFFLSSHL